MSSSGRLSFRAGALLSVTTSLASSRRTGVESTPNAATRHAIPRSVGLTLLLLAVAGFRIIVAAAIPKTVLPLPSCIDKRSEPCG